MNRIDEIRERLAGSRHEEWESGAIRHSSDHGWTVYTHPDEVNITTIEKPLCIFVACSPSDIQYLLDEVERKEQQIHELELLIKDTDFASYETELRRV